MEFEVNNQSMLGLWNQHHLSELGDINLCPYVEAFWHPDYVQHKSGKCWHVL